MTQEHFQKWGIKDNSYEKPCKWRDIGQDTF
jgi:hypothetical protein